MPDCLAHQVLHLLTPAPPSPLSAPHPSLPSPSPRPPLISPPFHACLPSRLPPLSICSPHPCLPSPSAPPVASGALTIAGNIAPASAGLALSYALDLTRYLKFGTQMASQTEANFNSVERIIQVTAPSPCTISARHPRAPSPCTIPVRHPRAPSPCAIPMHHPRAPSPCAIPVRPRPCPCPCLPYHPIPYHAIRRHALPCHRMPRHSQPLLDPAAAL